MSSRPPHNRAYTFTVVWTLGLLWLGSVVHATESSLACPDWPTCFGTFMPEMTGGVFWEHLHRLVAGGLILIWGAATWLTWRSEGDRPWLRRAAVAGLVLLLVQAVLGGVTVLLELPTAVSSSHLALAFLFLGFAVVLSLVTSPGWGRRPPLEPGIRRAVATGAGGAAALVFAQSLLGGTVRHTGAGLACPDVPLCLGRLLPPPGSVLIVLHWTHRVAGLVVAMVVLALAAHVLRRTGAGRLRALAWGAALTALAQVALGFVSVYTRLGVGPVSLHTLMAAVLLGFLVALAVYALEPAEGTAQAIPPSRDPNLPGRRPEPAGGPAHGR